MPILADLQMLIRDDDNDDEGNVQKEGDLSFENMEMVNLGLQKHSLFNRIYQSKFALKWSELIQPVFT